MTKFQNLVAHHSYNTVGYSKYIMLLHFLCVLNEVSFKAFKNELYTKIAYLYTVLYFHHDRVSRFLRIVLQQLEVKKDLPSTYPS